jgi:chemotaxis protein MotB
MRLLSLLLSGALLAGCGIRKDLHQAALDTIADTQDRVAACEGQLAEANAASSALDAALEQCKADVEAIAGARDEVIADNASLRAQLNEARRRLDEAGLSNEALAEANDRIQSMLTEAERALAEARRRQAAAEARDAIFRRLKDRLRAMIDAGKLNVRIVDGRMVIDLKQDILFPSGKADLSPLGVETLREVAQALSEFPDRRFQVEGHTDNVPISNDRFPSNWELSTARAVSVVKLFTERGMSPESVSAAGYGEFQPRASNDSAEGRTLNRRIEIAMLPDLQLLPDLVQDLE